MTDSKGPSRPLCRHCGEPLVQTGGDGTSQFDWSHGDSNYHLFRCQSGAGVSYGHNAAHPDVPCVFDGGNPCKCTYAPDPPLAHPAEKGSL